MRCDDGQWRAQGRRGWRGRPGRRQGPPAAASDRGAAAAAAPGHITGTVWLVVAVIVIAAALVVSQHTPWLRIDDRTGTWVLRQRAVIRTPWLTDVANGINVAGSGWGASVLGLSVLALTMAFRRWRHLAVFVGGLLFLDLVGELVYDGLSRPRPCGVPIITGWAGYAGGSPPVGVLTFCLLGIVYCLAAPGRARSRATAAAAAVVAVFVLARLYLGVEGPDSRCGGTYASVKKQPTD